MLKRDTVLRYYIFTVLFITFIHTLLALSTHKGKGRTTFYIPNSFLHACICLNVFFVLG